MITRRSFLSRLAGAAFVSGFAFTPKRQVVVHALTCYGKSITMAHFETLRRIQVMQRTNEAIALDYMIPTRALMPRRRIYIKRDGSDFRHALDLTIAILQQ
jgi:hypothetical protein